jgi:hypothetical protein
VFVAATGDPCGGNVHHSARDESGVSLRQVLHGNLHNPEHAACAPVVPAPDRAEGLVHQPAFFGREMSIDDAIDLLEDVGKGVSRQFGRCGRGFLPAVVAAAVSGQGHHRAPPFTLTVGHPFQRFPAPMCEASGEPQALHAKRMAATSSRACRLRRAVHVSSGCRDEALRRRASGRRVFMAADSFGLLRGE